MFRAMTQLAAAGLLLAPLSSAVRAQAPPRNPPHNVNVVGGQVFQAPQARVVPFQMQNAPFPQAVVLGPTGPALPQEIVIQRQLAAANHVLAFNYMQRQQLTGLLQEQLQLAALQDQLSLLVGHPNGIDPQKLAAMQAAVTAMQQQNLLQQLSILQP
ncbi:MAG TPA: hypothetical protein VMS17_21250 [Gemmataceae bacterium]|nr:hypothetical protein [Gemmataceae bacterium]